MLLIVSCTIKIDLFITIDRPNFGRKPKYLFVFKSGFGFFRHFSAIFWLSVEGLVSVTYRHLDPLKPRFVFYQTTSVMLSTVLLSSEQDLSRKYRNFKKIFELEQNSSAHC